MIEVKNLYKSFDGEMVLKDISATFESGIKLSGKAALKNCVDEKSIIGLFPIDSGQILYQERNLPNMNRNELKLLHQEAGMLFQGAALFDSMTVIENVMFPLEMFSKKSKQEMIERARFCLERVNLQPDTVSPLFPSK